MFIRATSTISHQTTFRNKGFSLSISDLDQTSSIQHPDYTAFIPKMKRRRMSDVLKMATACTLDCFEQIDLNQPDAIIVGTSLGCTQFTKKFLDKILFADGGLISPTSFISSTHNTIAGQLSLLLGNHNYNMTHTQNSLSFEQALIDGILCTKDGANNILIGAADEIEEVLYNVNVRLENHTSHIACGASFFILSTESTGPDIINLVDVGSFSLVDDRPEVMTRFLSSNNLKIEEIDLLLYSNSDPKTVDELSQLFDSKNLFDYQKISGTYFTNSAFAMDYAIDILLQDKHPIFGDKVRNILIYNNLIPENLGLILLENTKV